MLRGSSPLVAFHCMPAIVESPINDTDGASTGGAAWTGVEVTAGMAEHTRIAIVASTHGRREWLALSGSLRWVESDMVARYYSISSVSQTIHVRSTSKHTKKLTRSTPVIPRHHTSPSRQSQVSSPPMSKGVPFGNT